MRKINNPNHIQAEYRTPYKALVRLKSCPKCKSKRIWMANENMRIILGNDAPIEKPKWGFYCGQCDYQGPFMEKKAQAKAAWNQLERRKQT